jgi:methylase of polypeptide subunit release factors
MQAGGFDVIVGNPPYLELNKLKGAYSVIGYATQPTETYILSAPSVVSKS